MKTFVLFAALAATSFAQSEHWVATWAASPLETNVPAAPPAQAAKPAQGAPAAAAAKPQPIRSFNNQTIRMVVNPSIAGRTIRVELTNTFGKSRLKIGAAAVALHAQNSAIIPGSSRTLTFSGSPTAYIPAGAILLSDPVDLAIPALGDLVISLFLPEDSGPPTQHGTGLHTTYISSAGNFAAQPDFMAERTSNSWYFISGVHVLAPADTKAIVAFGDSITDGATSTVNANASWPSVLAKRIGATGRKDLAVINEGISGNRLLRDGAGMNALARFDRDVLAQPGVKYVIVLEGINDIGQGARANADPANAVTTEDILGAYRQMAARAHERGIKIIGATLTPYEGAAYASPAGESIRSAVNEWIRTSDIFDGYIDFDLATRDSENPKTIRKDYNISDHLHPNDGGYKAMGEAIDLALF